MNAIAPPLARTPLHAWQSLHGAQFVERDGWQLANVYSGVEAEVAAARDKVGLADLSACAKLRLDGPGVAALDAESFEGGVAPRPRSVAAFDADGPCLACRLSERTLLLLSSTIDRTALGRRVPERPNIVATDVTMANAGFALLGPPGEALLRRLTSFHVATKRLPPGACAETSVAGVHALLVRRPQNPFPETWVYVAADVAEYVWEKMLELGSDFGITPVGLQSLAALGFAYPS